MLNLIDTPGHVDFSYEVSRSLQAVEAAVLVVDATQGSQAQTLANVYMALEHNLETIQVQFQVAHPMFQARNGRYADWGMYINLLTTIKQQKKWI